MPPGLISSEASPDETDSPVFIESKPREAKEALLRDAVFTLEALPEPKARGFSQLAMPRHPRQTRRAQFEEDVEEFFEAGEEEV